MRIYSTRTYSIDKLCIKKKKLRESYSIQVKKFIYINYAEN